MQCASTPRKASRKDESAGSLSRAAGCFQPFVAGRVFAVVRAFSARAMSLWSSNVAKCIRALVTALHCARLLTGLQGERQRALRGDANARSYKDVQCGWHAEDNCCPLDDRSAGDAARSHVHVPVRRHCVALHTGATHQRPATVGTIGKGQGGYRAIGKSQAAAATARSRTLLMLGDTPFCAHADATARRCSRSSLLALCQFCLLDRVAQRRFARRWFGQLQRIGIRRTAGPQPARIGVASRQFGAMRHAYGPRVVPHGFIQCHRRPADVCECAALARRQAATARRSACGPAQPQ